jgi:hypothetical protein
MVAILIITDNVAIMSTRFAYLDFVYISASSRSKHAVRLGLFYGLFAFYVITCNRLLQPHTKQVSRHCPFLHYLYILFRDKYRLEAYSFFHILGVSYG